MRRLLVPLLALSLAPAASASASASQRIVGGTDVPPGQFDFVANVDIAGSASCSGTLIAPRWVMTAGHCGTPGGLAGIANPVPFPASAYTVTLGTVNTDGDGGEDHAVAGVHIADDYFFTNGQGSDVALLELAEPSAIAPLRIAARDERHAWEPGDMMTAAGFGVTEPGGDAPEVMQQVQVPIVADATCAKAYTDPTPILGDRFDPATEVCAGYEEGGKDSCQGDSGGPLMAPVGDGLRLVGATSRGQGCAEPGYPGIYARVAAGSLRAFVAGLVPEAFEPENTTDAPQDPEPSPEPQACAGATRVLLRVKPKSRLRRVRVKVGGRTVAKRRNVRRPFRVNLSRHLPRQGTARVRIVMKPVGAKRIVKVRTYRDCRLKRGRR